MTETNYKYMVCTICATYNHANYIEETLRGFIMQETKFPVVYCIIDDASTDMEQEVLRKWIEENLASKEEDGFKQEECDFGEKIVAPSKSRKNLFFVFVFLKENHYGKQSKQPYYANWRNNAKYVAFCEGDDYWNDSYKLQKQVDFLESHPDYGLVHTDYMEYNQKKEKYNYKQRQCIDGDITANLIRGDFYIATLTTCFRKDIYETINRDYLTQGFLMGDLPLWIEMSRLTKVKYLPDKTAVYRVLENSAAHSTSKLKHVIFQKNVYKIREYFINKYSYDEVKKENERNLHYLEALTLALQSKPRLALVAFIKSFHFNAHDIAKFIKCILKPEHRKII